jgi:hypothetical protein
LTEVNRTAEKFFFKVKWPDIVELRKNEDGTRKLVFIFSRGNSRPFDYHQTDFAHTLREFGHEVYVRIAGLADISIEEFERHGIYSTKVSQTVQGRQGLFNKTSELRLLEGELATLSQDDPVYFHKAQRISHIRAMLSTAESTPSLEALKKSDQRLNHLIESVKNAPQRQITKPSELSEDFLRKSQHRVFVEMYGLDTPEMFEAFSRKNILFLRDEIVHKTEQLKVSENLELREELIALEAKLTQLQEQHTIKFPSLDQPRLAQNNKAQNNNKENVDGEYKQDSGSSVGETQHEHEKPNL